MNYWPIGRAGILVAVQAISTFSHAQYDVGFGIGAYKQWLREAPVQDDHYYADFDDFESPGLSATVFYRETSKPHVNFTAEVLYLRRSFLVRQGYAGLGSSTSESLQADLDLLYVNVLPEVRMDDNGVAVVRFGPMIGFRVGGRVSGSSYQSSGGNVEATTYENVPATMLKGDLRFHFGIGFRTINTPKVGVSFDANYNLALGSLLKEKPGSRGSDISITIALFKRVQHTGLFSRGKKQQEE
jgi:hypothetical protein